MSLRLPTDTPASYACANETAEASSATGLFETTGRYGAAIAVARCFFMGAPIGALTSLALEAHEPRPVDP
jgi:hypothetical protein